MLEVPSLEALLKELLPCAMCLLPSAIIGREITMSALREWAAALGDEARKAVAVNNLGKWKTATQVIPAKDEKYVAACLRFLFLFLLLLLFLFQFLFQFLLLLLLLLLFLSFLSLLLLVFFFFFFASMQGGVASCVADCVFRFSRPRCRWCPSRCSFTSARARRTRWPSCQQPRGLFSWESRRR